MEKKNIFSHGSLGLITALLGIISGWLISYQLPLTHYLLKSAETFSKLFLDLIQLISLPIIFLSIVATLSGMESIDEMRRIGKKIIKYTMLTTLIAATIALILFLLIDPSQITIDTQSLQTGSLGNPNSYLDFLLAIIPSNVVKALSDNKNVMSVVFIAGLLVTAILALGQEHREPLRRLFAGLFADTQQITH